MTDDAGNSVVIYLAIDTTAPIVVVRSENGDIVTQNGATNQNVTVTCDEVGAEIRVSKDGRNWNTYDNGLLENVGKYYFEISDIVGNVTAFAITIDKTVDYAIRGDYNVVNGAYISNTSLMILAQEDFGQFTVQSSNGVSFNLNERVYDEGEYIVSITDVVGNAVSLRLVIDKTPPKIDLTGVQHKGKTKTDVHVIMLGYANATITENGAREQITGQEFDVTKEGIYTIEASDDAGTARR